MSYLVLAPFQPTEEQWGGLARDIVWWMRSYPSNKHTPATLVEHLNNLGREIPAWMGSEAELRTQDHVISKGTIAVLIYKAMLAAAPQQGGELIDELSMMAQMLGERDPADELSLLLFRAVGALRMAAVPQPSAAPDGWRLIKSDPPAVGQCVVLAGPQGSDAPGRYWRLTGIRRDDGYYDANGCGCDDATHWHTLLASPGTLAAAPAPVVQLPACKGADCGCTDGRSHSPECEAEHAAAIAGGAFVQQPTDATLDAAPVSAGKAQGATDEQAAFEAAVAAVNERGWSTSTDLARQIWDAARLNAAPVQQVSVPDVSAMARMLADRNADACNVNREDNWAIYGQGYIDDVTAMLAAAPAAPAADAGLVEALRELAEQFREAWPDHTGKYHFLIGAGLSIAAHRAKGVA